MNAKDRIEAADSVPSGAADAFVRLNHPMDVDLQRHALIEASAGTGKTFTIERLVVRGLIENALPLSRILAVTFTEKAAGELKDRIRAYLETVLLGTSTEGDDARWIDEQIRRQGMSLLRRVEESLDRFDEAAVFTIHGFCQSVLREYGFDLGRLLNYKIVDDGPILEELILDRYRRWPGELGHRLEEVLVDGQFWKRYPGSGRDINYRWDELLQRLAMQVRDEDDLRIPEDARQDEGMLLLLESIRHLQSDLREYKAARGVISYDDMIRRVLDALTGPGGSAIADGLADRYRLAVVDEFQDTDPVQWEIFRRIFLETGESRLILVGDPKQAIYGFRGADVQTYLRARTTLQERAASGLANLYRLEFNYRSRREYVRVSNALFSRPAWFWSADEKAQDRIQFHESQASEQDNWEGTDPPEGRSYLNLWTCSVPEKDGLSAAEAARFYARFVSREINRLKNSRWQLRKRGAQPRSFNEGDVAVLVVNTREASLIMRELREAGIPATHYKQAGVFRSREAYEILYVLEAIADPGRRAVVQRALLTRFFGFDLSRMHEVDQLAVDDPVRVRLQEWQELAGQSLWPRLFRSFLAHPDSAVRRQVELDPSGWERTFTNYEQILQILEEDALRRGDDLGGIIRALKARLRDPGGLSEEETLHRQETEEARVRVLTMHASKGLEFPVVFVAGGFTARTTSDWSLFYEEGRRVHGLHPFSEEGRRSAEVADWKKRHANRSREEDARLFYVALTRAGIISYIPLHRPHRSLGSGSLCTFIHDALEQALEINSEDLCLIDDSSVPGREVIRDGKGQGRSGQIVPGTLQFAEDGSRPADAPVVELPSGLRERRAELHSYSSLSLRQSSEPRMDMEGTENEDLTPDLLLDEQRPYQSLSPELDRMFRGARAGNLFHEILERIDYQDDAFKSDAFKSDGVPILPSGTTGEETGAEKSLFWRLSPSNRNIIRYRLRAHGFGSEDQQIPDSLSSSEEEEAAALLGRVLSTELLPGFCLRDLNPEDRIHEMEFFFAHQHNSSAAREEFITGFVDLIFRHNGRLYLLDWKTNLLEDYSEAFLNRAIRSMKYDLQYALYAKAVNGWLSAREKADRLTGVFYLFLRGMHPDSRDGIYYTELSQDQIDRIVDEGMDA